MSIFSLKNSYIAISIHVPLEEQTRDEDDVAFHHFARGHKLLLKLVLAYHPTRVAELAQNLLHAPNRAHYGAFE